MLWRGFWAFVVLHFARDGTNAAGGTVHSGWHECGDYKNITRHDSHSSVSTRRALCNSCDFDGIHLFPLCDFLHGMWTKNTTINWRLFASKMADACLEGAEARQKNLRTEAEGADTEVEAAPAEAEAAPVEAKEVVTEAPAATE